MASFNYKHSNANLAAQGLWRNMGSSSRVIQEAPRSFMKDARKHLGMLARGYKPLKATTNYGNVPVYRKGLNKYKTINGTTVYNHGNGRYSTVPPRPNLQEI